MHAERPAPKPKCERCRMCAQRTHPFCQSTTFVACYDVTSGKKRKCRCSPRVSPAGERVTTESAHEPPSTLVDAGDGASHSRISSAKVRRKKASMVFCVFVCCVYNTPESDGRCAFSVKQSDFVASDLVGGLNTRPTLNAHSPSAAVPSAAVGGQLAPNLAPPSPTQRWAFICQRHVHWHTPFSFLQATSARRRRARRIPQSMREEVRPRCSWR
jgi:hypothetical protein